MINGTLARNQRALRRAQESWDNLDDTEYENQMMNEPEEEDNECPNRPDDISKGAKSIPLHGVRLDRQR